MQYMKALFAGLAAVAGWGVTAAADGAYDQVELFGLLAAVVAAIGVYFIPYVPASGGDGDDAGI